MSSTDLFSAGLGVFGQSRSWSNISASDTNGSGNSNSQAPLALAVGPYTIAIASGSNALWFDLATDNVYTERFALKDTLTHNVADQELVLTDMAGNQTRFHDFDSSLSFSQQGRLKSFADPAGPATRQMAIVNIELPDDDDDEPDAFEAMLLMAAFAGAPASRPPRKKRRR